MKKIISLLLSFIMMISITSGLDFSAYAEESELSNNSIVVLNERSDIYINAGEYGYFYFTPEEDGFYNIHIASEPKISSYINEADGSDEDADFLGTDSESDYIRCLTAGITYAIKLNVNTLYGGLKSATVALTITTHNHSYSEELTEAKCNAEGKIDYTCDVCFYSYTEVLAPDASKHMFSVNGICTVCGAEDENYVKSVHDIAVGETKSVIVKSSGETETFSFTAEEENFYFIELKSKKGNYNLKVFNGDGERIVNANISSSSYDCRISASAGEKYRFEVTKNSAENYDVSITKHQHTLKSTEVKAGCDSLGYTYHCCSASYCEYEYMDNYVPATGKHKFRTTVVAPTCSMPGYTEYSCSECDTGYIYNYTSPAKNKHSYENGFCTECGAISSSITIGSITLNNKTDVTASSSKPSVVSFKPKTSGWYTLSSSGKRDTFGILLDSNYEILEQDDDSGSSYNYSIDYVLNAGETYYLVTQVDSTSNVTISILVEPHVHKYFSLKQAATCGEKGCTLYYCSCGAAYFDKITPATNKHKWVTDEKVDATCVDDGYTVQYCSVCGEAKTTVTSKENGLHKYENNVCIYCDERRHNTEVKDVLDITTGTTVNVSFDKANQITYLNFKPEKDGYYMFQSFGVYDTYVTMADKYGYPLAEDDNSALANNCRIVTYFEAGYNYQFRIEVTDADSGNYDVSITPHTHEFAECTIPPSCGEEGITLYTCKDCFYSYESNYVMPTYKHTFKDGMCTQCGEFDDNYKVPEIKPGQTKTVKQYEEGYFTFTPEYTSEYKIYATGKQATMVMVADVFGNILALALANNTTDYNFNVAVTLYSGVQYYIFTSAADIESYNVVLDYNHKHSYKTSAKTTKATKSANGKVVTTYTCKTCGYTYSKTTKTIYKPTTYTLSTSTYTYNGSAKKPSVTIKDSKGNKLKSGTDYTVTYPSGRKNVGKYTIKITFKGNYSGTATKTFTIKPKNTSLSSVSAGKKKFTVKWKKYTTQTTGYQIQYSTDKNFKK
ncbi:MAG: hypothetical protein NC397_03855, partial [Clostridium sp.]|nr:hypothetical protein [Clostridium sp.]